MHNNSPKSQKLNNLRRKTNLPRRKRHSIALRPRYAINIVHAQKLWPVRKEDATAFELTFKNKRKNLLASAATAAITMNTFMVADEM